jgi:hypothetical protein
VKLHKLSRKYLNSGSFNTSYKLRLLLNYFIWKVAHYNCIKEAQDSYLDWSSFYVNWNIAWLFSVLSVQSQDVCKQSATKPCHILSSTLSIIIHKSHLTVSNVCIWYNIFDVEWRSKWRRALYWKGYGLSFCADCSQNTEYRKYFLTVWWATWLILSFQCYSLLIFNLLLDAGAVCKLTWWYYVILRRVWNNYRNMSKAVEIFERNCGLSNQPQL